MILFHATRAKIVLLLHLLLNQNYYVNSLILWVVMFQASIMIFHVQVKPSES